MTLRLLALSALLGTSAAAAPQSVQGKLLAVLEFNSKLEGADRKAVDPQYLADTVRGAVLDAVPDMQVMTRENEMVLLEGQGKKLSECEGECEVDTGRRLGADLVISGDLLKFGSSYKLTLKLHETVDGRLLSSVQASGRTIDELDADLQLAVRKLLRPLTGDQPLTKPGTQIAPPTPVPQAPFVAPRPTPSRGPRLAIGTESSKTYDISVRAGSKTFNCPNRVSSGSLCELYDVPTGSITLVVKGDANQEHTFNFSPSGLRIMIDARGKWPIFLGLGLTGAGVLLLYAGTQTSNSSETALADIYGALLGVPGVVFLIFGLARSPVSYDETTGESFLLRDEGKVQLAGLGLTPVPGGAMASAAFRF